MWQVFLGDWESDGGRHKVARVPPHPTPGCPWGWGRVTEAEDSIRQMKPRSSLSAWGTAQKDSFICCKRASLAITNALFSRNEELLWLLAGGNEKPLRRTSLSHWLATEKQLTLYLLMDLFISGPMSNCESQRRHCRAERNGVRQTLETLYRGHDTVWTLTAYTCLVQHWLSPPSLHPPPQFLQPVPSWPEPFQVSPPILNFTFSLASLSPPSGATLNNTN